MCHHISDLKPSIYLLVLKSCRYSFNIIEICYTHIGEYCSKQNTILQKCKSSRKVLLTFYMKYYNVVVYVFHFVILYHIYAIDKIINIKVNIKDDY